VRWVEALEFSSPGVRVQYAAGQRTVIPGPFPTPQELSRLLDHRGQLEGTSS